MGATVEGDGWDGRRVLGDFIFGDFDGEFVGLVWNDAFDGGGVHEGVLDYIGGGDGVRAALDVVEGGNVDQGLAGLARTKSEEDLRGQ